ncbi:MAG: PQQ-binding-like beta-propeller repeat protein [Candidatus Tyrphobacter sp.]
MAVATLCACSQTYASDAFGVAGASDPSVRVFHSDVARAWTSFRLGGGLNVVVVNASVPREFAWRFQTGPQGISSSPVVYGTTLLVDSNDHHLYAADLRTGRILWRYKAESDVMSQPVYENGVAFIGTGTGDCSAYFPPYYVAMNASIDHLEAVDLATGKEVWTTGISGTGMPTPAIVGGSLIHVDGTGVVLALDPKSGAFRWRSNVPSIFSMTGLIDGGDARIYAPGSFPDAVYAWNARNGRLAWRHLLPPLAGGVSDGPMASTRDALVGMYLEPLRPGPQGWVVQYGSLSREHVYALDKRSGRLLWNRTLDNVRGVAPARNESAIPLVYRNTVYVGSSVAPVVSALDVRTGRVLWQTRTGGAVKGGLVARDGVVYFGDLGGYLWAVDARTGSTIGRKEEGLKFNVGSPIVVNDTLVDGSNEGTVVAVPLRWIRDSHD